MTATANPFEQIADAQMASAVKARHRATEKRLAKLVIKSDADAPMVVSPAEKQMFEQSKLLRLYNKDLTQRRLDLLNGPHGNQVKELLQIMDSLAPSSAPGLLSFLARCNWFLQAERGVRQNILSLISIGIMRHRVREGLAPFDDSLPGEEPTAFEIIRTNMRVLS